MKTKRSVRKRSKAKIEKAAMARNRHVGVKKYENGVMAKA